MTRDLRALADTTFDVAIVGAGIYGALAAWDAARRGLTVALIDRGDFGGATSANSMRTLHGGLRSLQSLNIRQMRLFIRERRAMAMMAPHLIDPLPFCVPTYHHPTRNTWAMRAALAVTDLIGRDRNDGIVDDALRLPGGRVVSRTECLRLNPIVDPTGITGGAVWFDYQMRQQERLLVSIVASAAAAGAVVANYVEARGLVTDGSRLTALTVRDAHTDTAFDIRTRNVLNTTGPWSGALARALTNDTARQAPRLSRAMNLVVTRITDTHACGATVAGRVLLAVPWRDVTIVGTSHDPHEGGADDPHGTRDQVAAFLRDAQLAFPRAGMGPDTVQAVHRGLLPASAASTTTVRLLKESAVIDHATDGCQGLFSVHSVRYTTAGHTARAAVDAVCRRCGIDTPALPRPLRVTAARYETVASLVAGAQRCDVPATSPATRERLARTYGSAWARLAQEATVEDLQPLSASCSVTRAEVVHAVRHECAMRLTDVVLRRTDAGTAGPPGPVAIAAAAAVMGHALGWTDAQVAAEIAAVDATYRMT